MLKKGYPVCVFLLLASLVFHHYEAGAAAWQVEPGSVGNELVLDVANTSTDPVRDVVVSVEESPKWVHFAENEVSPIEVLKPAETEKVRFLFDVSEEVSSGTEGTVELLLKGAEGSWSKEVVLTVVSPTLLPKVTALHQNSPNPFQQSTVVRYQLSAPAQTTLRIYNLAGCQIRTLVNEKKHAGHYQMEWDGKDDAENIVPNGIYFYRLESMDFRATKKLIFLR